MARWNTIARGAAVAAVATLALAACSTDSGTGASTSASGDSSASGDALKIGTLLPITGSLAFLGPPEIAGVKLAVSEINDAGGVLGQPVEEIDADSSDTANPQIASQSVSSLIADGVGGIVGAASSSVSLNVVDDIAAASVVQISPANTSTALSGYSPFYFRVAPPDTVQGNALANVIIDDGIKNLGILVFEDDYGTSLRDVIVSTAEAAGVNITYGATETFDPNATNFSAEVQAVMATNPDAIAVIAFDQTKQIIPELVGAGFDGSKLYFTDGNTADYSADLPAGTLEGAKGTIPGAMPSTDFQALLDGANGSKLDSYSYGAESYDSTMLLALAAVRGGATDGATIQANMAAVSGADGGTECSGFQECADLLASGEEIAYKSVSGSGAFNAQNDPSSAYIGVYVFDGDNVPVWTEAVYGEVPAA
ncbi:ABC transporter substrate-binding protein [Demequina capsici]|uniref:ABC transporter substrate-binding protein n=1 Tax=Demequina capsici TaxID=3075620 RepID=A0AA96FA31_9MICO|nr:MULTISPECIES: ABC transporter substrate-binding protein [unclassified Demequina]WNM25943.1 ABC transporter substrate-binding protein [Demequina sp. OYTSA14]WNM26048.1 ABC transporter substrate-binding protein [Demequina sp. PMTSA13]